MDIPLWVLIVQWSLMAVAEVTAISLAWSGRAYAKAAFAQARAIATELPGFITGQVDDIIDGVHDAVEEVAESLGQRFGHFMGGFFGGTVKSVTKEAKRAVDEVAAEAKKE